MIAGDHHDFQPGQALVGRNDEVVEPLLGQQRRVDGVEEVTGDQQGIGLLLLQLVEQPGEEGEVLVVTILAVQGLAKMPVGRVDQAHGRSVNPWWAVRVRSAGRPVLRLPACAGGKKHRPSVRPA